MTQRGPDVAGAWGLFEWLLVIGPIVVLLLVVFYIARKSRPMDGAHVFRASRLTRGNRLFPAQVAITPASITLLQPQWIGKREESIHMAHVSSVMIDTGLLFSDVRIDTSGGSSPIRCRGLSYSTDGSHRSHVGR